MFEEMLKAGREEQFRADRDQRDYKHETKRKWFGLSICGAQQQNGKHDY